MDNNTIIHLLGAGLAGGAVGQVLNYAIRSHNSKRDDFATIVKTWQEDNHRLRTENESLRSRLNRIEEEVYDLRSKVILMESAHTDAPLPMWLKDAKGIILSVNKAYEETFLAGMGKTASDYIGYDDYSVWPDDIAAVYRVNDARVIRGKKPWRGREPVIVNGNKEDYRILKYPRYAGNIFLGIAGIAIPEKWDDEHENN